MKTHTYRSPRSVLSGSGSVTSVSLTIEEYGSSKPVVICDEGIYNAGLHKTVVDDVIAQGIAVELNTGAESEPSVKAVERVADEVRRGGYDCVIGLGGGSSLDTAKLAAVFAVNQTGVKDVLGIDLVPRAGIPMIMIPTTAGTGSEMTPNAIVSLPDEGRKAGVVSPFLVPDTAILDPDLTLSLPQDITASTGLDALIHCLESYIGKKANTLGDGFALQGLRLITGSLKKAYLDEKDMEARLAMLIGASFGGMALTASGTAAVHALAYATGAKYHIPHGVANSMLLVPVLERSLSACESRLAEVGSVIGVGRDAGAVLEYLSELAVELDIPTHLDRYGYQDDDLDDLVTAALKVTRLLNNNPMPFEAEDIREVFLSIGNPS